MTAKPETVLDWEGYVKGLDTPEKFVAAQNSGEFAKNLKSYVNAKNAERDELFEQLKVQNEAVLTEFIKNNKGSFDGASKLDLNYMSSKNQFDGVYNNSRAIGAGLNGKFANKAEFFQAVWHRARPDAETRAKLDLAEIANSFSERVPDSGGYMVPEEFRSDILQLALETSLVRPSATIIPMSSLKLSYPAVDDTDHTTSVHGGIQGVWVEEGATIPESQATFAQVKLEAKKLAALAVASNELVRDWGAFGGWINNSLPRAISWFEDLAYISGSGVGKPLGMLSASNPALLVAAARAGQGASTIVWENALDMYARLLPQSINTAEWWVSPDAFVQLATMALSVGTGGSAVWLVDGHGKPQLTLLGLPVRMSEKVPAALGSQGDFNLVDPKMYLIGDRQTMTVESSAHVRFTSDQTVFRCIERVDGQPWLLGPVTPQNNSASLSSFITLNGTRT